MPFNNNGRREWQNPEAILSVIGLKPGETFIDIGCGNGFFALPAARIVGASGTVYGIDISSDSIAELKKQALKENLNNIRLTAGKAEETVICERCADVVFIGIALHDFEDPSLVLENARKMVKPSGKLIDLDWKKEPTPFGPPLSIRFDEKKAKALLEAAGFAIETTENSGPYHYIVTARPSLAHDAAIGCRLDLHK